MESINNLTKTKINEILDLANYFKREQTRNDSLSKYIFGLFFFESSTRTLCSFESAIHRLGGKIIQYNRDNSSEKKGESLTDTIITLEKYVDVLIIRHPSNNFIPMIKDLTKKPIINAGNGSGEHPTQALLDLFTIIENFPSLPKTVLFIGDNRYSRTVHSLLYLLNIINPEININCINDNGLEIPTQISKTLNKERIRNSYILDVNMINKSDVIYITRLQKERYNQNKQYNNPFIIDHELIKNTPENTIVLHPFPRNEELSTNIDATCKNKYFDQMENGVYVRMSIIYLIIKELSLNI
jgi:aspartate carbamoyltransferase